MGTAACLVSKRPKGWARISGVSVLMGFIVAGTGEFEKSAHDARVPGNLDLTVLEIGGRRSRASRAVWIVGSFQPLKPVCKGLIFIA